MSHTSNTSRGSVSHYEATLSGGLKIFLIHPYHVSNFEQETVVYNKMTVIKN